MKVLQVLPTLSAGGAEGFVTNLGVSLAALGVQVRFFLLAGVRRERGQTLLARLQDAGIEVIGTEQRKAASLTNLLRLVHCIRDWRPDIVQANLYSCEVAGAGARLLLLGSDACFVRRLASTEQSGYRSRMMVRTMDRFYRQTIACSPSVANSYRDFMGKQQRSHLVTITNGAFLLDAVPDTIAKQQARQVLDIPEQAFVITHIGRMLGSKTISGSGLETEPKAQDVLLQAFALAFKNDSNCLLILVGDGPLRPEAEALAHSLGIGHRVRFLGEQPEPWPALKAADLFCFPSRHEGLPNALVEAASCGLPVIASDIPEISSLSPGDAWQLVPVDDVSRFASALQMVRADLEVFAHRAREASQVFREKFSMKTCAEEYLKAYNLALKASRTE